MSPGRALLASALLASCGNGGAAIGRVRNVDDGGSRSSGGSKSDGGSMEASTGGASAGGAANDAGGASGGATPIEAGETSDSSTDGGADLCTLYGEACCSPAIASVSPDTACTLDVLEAWLDTTYEYADLEQKVASLPRDVLVSFTDADIAWAAATAPPAGLVKWRLTPEASMAKGTALLGAARHPFRLSCDGEELFVGVIYDVYGAAALRTPVLHVEREESGDVLLRLGAWQGAWMGLLRAEDVEAQERIDRAELRAALCRRGALHVLTSDAIP